jgi:hypothetical protein
MRHCFKKIVDILAHERTYQLFRWGVPAPTDNGLADKPKSIGEYILYMEHHLHLARVASSTLDDNDPEALNQLRKVTTLGLACFEQHGVPPRKGGMVTNGHDGSTRFLPDLVG